MPTCSRAYKILCSRYRSLLTRQGFHRKQYRESVGSNVWVGLEPLEQRVLLSSAMWTGDGDGRSWNDPNNWERQDIGGIIVNAIPQDGDEVEIPDVPETTEIVFDGAVRLVGLDANEDIQIVSGVLTLDGASEFNNQLTLFNGTLDGAGDVLINGRFEWWNGTLGGSGQMTINSTMEIGFSSGTNLLSRTLNNNGVVDWTFHNFEITSTGRFNNLAGAVFNARSESNILGVGLFDNGGHFLSDLDNTVFVSPSLHNNGTVDVADGVLTLRGDGTHTGMFVGSGTLRFDGGTHMIDETVVFPESLDVALLSGALDGTGDVLINGRFEWWNGTLGGSGQITVNGTMEIGFSSGANLLSRTLNNNGVVDWTFRDFEIASDGRFNNLEDAVFNARSESIIRGTGTFNNTGRFISEVENTVIVGASLHNSGSVQVVTGTLDLTGGYTQTAGNLLLAGGSVASSSGLRFQDQGGHLAGSGVISADIIMTGGIISPGVASGSIGSFTINGDLALATGASLLFDLTGNSTGTEFDSLLLNGNAFLNGADLLVSIPNDAADFISDTDIFELIMMSEGAAINGAFDNVGSGDRIFLPDVLGSFLVEYGSVAPVVTDRVILSQFQSELPSLPDLAIRTSRLTYTPIDPSSGDTVTIRAAITNFGLADATDVKVDFFDLDGRIDPGPMDISILRPGETVEVSVQTTFPSDDVTLITAQIDPENTILELRESNNNASVLLADQLDPAIADIVIAVPDSLEAAREEVVIFGGRIDYDFATVAGDQDFPVQGGQVTLSLIDPDNPDGSPEVFSVGSTDVNGRFRASFISPEADGTYAIQVSATDGTVVKEAQIMLTVSGLAEDPVDRPRDPVDPPTGGEGDFQDVFLFSEDIFFSEEQPDIGEAVAAFAAVHYFGDIPAEDVPISIYAIFPGDGGDLQQFEIHSTTLSFPVTGQVDTVLVSLPYIGVPGAQVIEVVAQPSFTQPPQNDAATRLLFVGSSPQVNLDKSVQLLDDVGPAGFSPGDTLRYTIEYENFGGVDLTGVTMIDDFNEALLQTPFNVTGGVTPSEGKLTWIIGDLLAGESGLISYDVLIGPEDVFPIGTTQVVNNVILTAEEVVAIADAVSVMVQNNANDPPIVMDDAGMVQAGMIVRGIDGGIDRVDMAPDPVVGNVLDNDSDPEGDALMVANAGLIAGQYGTLTLNIDGSYGYDLDDLNAAVITLQDGETLTDAFTYVANDGSEQTEAELLITVHGANDPPLALDDVAAVQAGTTVLNPDGSIDRVDMAPGPVVGNLLDNDSDPEGDALTVDNVGLIAGQYGTLTLSSDGSYSYDLDDLNADVIALKAGEGLADTFEYTAGDGVKSDDAVLIITVAGTNDPPVAVDDLTWGTDEDTAIDIPVRLNDFDPDAGDEINLTVVDITGTLGRASINPDGTIHYDPDKQFEHLATGETGFDAFSYTISDEDGLIATATVVVTIFGVNDAPTVVDLLVNGGQTQRSMATRIDVQFSEDVSDSLAPSDLTLVNLTADEPVDPSAIAVAFDPITNTATFTFPGLVGGSLEDGNYVATLPASGISDVEGYILDGNGDGIEGDDYHFDLYRLFGDSESDRDVDKIDRSLFLETFGSNDPDPLYNPIFDSDSDGDVDQVDRSRFNDNFPSELTAQLQITARLNRDTGPDGTTNDDGVTFDPTITGRVSFADQAATVRAGLDGMTAAAYVDVTDDLGANGGFLFDQAKLEAILDGPLEDTDHTFTLVAEDGQGVVLDTAEVSFTLKATPVRVTDISPAAGEEMVSVTRETIVRFDGQVDPSTITPDTFYLIANGQRVEGQIRVSSTRRFMTFFYDQPLPASTEVRVVVEGGSIMGLEGRLIDPNGNGEVGETQTADFRTLPLTRIAGTNVFGFVRDSMTGHPLVGVTIRVDAFPEADAVTDSNGRFELVDMPAPEFFVHIDGSTATHLNVDGQLEPIRQSKTTYPNVGKPFHSVPGQTVQIEMDREPFDIYLPSMAVSDVKPLKHNGDTEVGFGSTGIKQLEDMFPEIEKSVWDQFSVTFPVGSAVDDQGNPATEAAIIPVPPDRLPAPLPPNVNPKLVVSIQAPGATNFDVPAPITFPNLDGLAPGEKMLIMSFDHDAGDWKSVGTGTVSDDGLTVASDPGVGILAPGWNFPRFAEVINPLKAPILRDNSWAEMDSGVEALWELIERIDERCGPLNNDPDDPIGANKKYKECVREFIKCAGTAIPHVIDGLRKGIFTGTKLLKEIIKELLEELKEQIRDTFVTSSINATQGALSSSEPEDTIEILSEDAFSVEELVPVNIATLDVRITFGSPLARPLEVGDAVELDDDQLASLGLSTSSRAALVVTEVESENQGIVQIVFVEVPQLPGEVADTIYGALEPNEPENPLLYVAEISQAGETIRVSGQTEAFGDYSILVPVGASVRTISFYDPQTSRFGAVVARSDIDGMPRPRLVPVDDTFFDFDGDGLADLVEYVVGTNLQNSDTDGDGINDQGELLQGLDPLDGRSFPTGVIASLPLNGETTEIVTSTAGLEQQIAYVATGSYGLAVIDTSQFDNPIVLGQLQLAGQSSDIGIDPQIPVTVVASNEGGLHFVDTSDLMLPSVIQTVDINASQVEVFNGVVYVSEGSRLLVYDLLTAEKLHELRLEGADIAAMTREGSTLYTTDTDRVLRAIDLQDGLVLSPRGALQLPGEGNKLFAGDGIVYTVVSRAGRGGYQTVDVSDPDNLMLISESDVPPLSSAPDIALAANGSGRGVLVGVVDRIGSSLPVFDVMDLSDPQLTNQLLFRILLPSRPFGVALGSGVAYVAGGTSGIHVVNYMPFDNLGQLPTVTVDTGIEDPDPNTPGIQIEQGSMISVSASASDDAQIERVEWLVDDQVVHRDAAFPYDLSLSLPINESEVGTVAILARAIDTGGNTAVSDPIVFDIVPDTSAPIVTNTTPFEGGLHGRSLRTIRVAFSESMDITSLTAENIQLFPATTAGSVLPPSDVRVLSDDRVLHLTYDSIPPDEYNLVIRSDQVTDRAGNALGAIDVVSHFTVFDADVVWINPSGGHWDGEDNWDLGRIPGPNDDVYIGVPGDVAVMHRTGSTQIKSLAGSTRIELIGGTLDLSHSVMRVDNEFVVDGGILANATLLPEPTAKPVRITNNVNNGLSSVTIEGELTLGLFDTVRIFDGLTLNGIIHFTGGARVRFEESAQEQVLNGNGQLIFDATGSSSINQLGINGNTMVTIGPEMTLRGGNVLIGVEILPGTTTLINQGSIFAELPNEEMEILSDGFQNQGIIRVSDDSFLLTEHLTQSPSGMIDIAIGDATASRLPIQINQIATLDGSLNLSLEDGFVPSVGQSFKIMTYNSRIGEFATVTGTDLGGGLSFDIAYNPLDVTLTTVSATPVTEFNQTVNETANIISTIGSLRSPSGENSDLRRAFRRSRDLRRSIWAQEWNRMTGLLQALYDRSFPYEDQFNVFADRIHEDGQDDRLFRL